MTTVVEREIKSPAATSPFRWPAFTAVAAATVILFAIGLVISPRSVSLLSLQTMLPFAAILAIAAVGQTLVVQQRGIDLSVGGMISLAAMGVGVLSGRWGWPLIPSVLLTFVACALFGLLNGVLVSRFRLTPLVATLATNSLLIGAVAALTGGSPAAAPEGLVSVATFDVLGQPLLVWIALAFVIVMAVVTTRTVWGRRFVASGANPDAARVSGVNVQTTTVLAYVSAACCYSIAGMLLIGLLRNSGTGVGNEYMLTVIATVIVGGTPLIGGRGTIIGSAIAAVFLSQLVQMVLTLGAPSSTQMLIQALAIGVAAVLQGISLRRRPKKR